GSSSGSCGCDRECRGAFPSAGWGAAARAGRRCAACRASAASVANLAIAAAEVEQRLALAGEDVDDLADEDGVIAARQLLVQAAFDRGQCARDERNVERAGERLYAGKAVVAARCELRRNVSLSAAENAHAEFLRGDDGV